MKDEQREGQIRDIMSNSLEAENVLNMLDDLQEEVSLVREQNKLLIKGLKQCTQDIEWGESLSKHIDKIKRIAVETLNNHARS